MIRFVCRVRSSSSVPRSRVRRRRSSSPGVGGTTMAQTRGSPRRQASSVLSSVSPSMASVFARRCRRGTAIDAGSTTWLSTPSASSSRCSQKPSLPASWTTTTPTGPPADRSTLPRRRASRASSAAPSPAATECFDILRSPGASDVTSHVDRLSSRDAYSVAWWCRSRGGSCSGHGPVGCIGSSLRCCRRSPHRTRPDGIAAPWNLYQIYGKGGKRSGLGRCFTSKR